MVKTAVTCSHSRQRIYRRPITADVLALAQVERATVEASVEASVALAEAVLASHANGIRSPSTGVK